MEKLVLEKELLFEGKESTTSVKVADFTFRGVPFEQGVQLEITLAGAVGGKIAGQIYSTHYMLMKPDGTSEVNL